MALSIELVRDQRHALPPSLDVILPARYVEPTEILVFPLDPMLYSQELTLSTVFLQRANDLFAYTYVEFQQTLFRFYQDSFSILNSYQQHPHEKLHRLPEEIGENFAQLLTNKYYLSVIFDHIRDGGDKDRDRSEDRLLAWIKLTGLLTPVIGYMTKLLRESPLAKATPTLLAEMLFPLFILPPFRSLDSELRSFIHTTHTHVYRMHPGSQLGRQEQETLGRLLCFGLPFLGAPTEKSLWSEITALLIPHDVRKAGEIERRPDSP